MNDHLFKLCICGFSLTIILLIIIAIGVWTMPNRMDKND